MFITERTPAGMGTPVISAGAPVPRLGIAMVASRGDLRTPPPGVERMVGPFYRCSLAQRSNPLSAVAPAYPSA
jgi:hypothetical protein